MRHKFDEMQKTYIEEFLKGKDVPLEIIHKNFLDFFIEKSQKTPLEKTKFKDKVNIILNSNGRANSSRDYRKESLIQNEINVRKDLDSYKRINQISLYKVRGEFSTYNNTNYETLILDKNDANVDLLQR